MDTQLEFTRALVRSILLDKSREWTVQGFGFLRTYFGPTDRPKQYRLNLWDKRFSVPNVSTIHDHPWDLTSLIVAGQMANQRYVPSHIAAGKPTHAFTTIKTGVDGGIDRDGVSYCHLIPQPRESYKIGDTYAQRADEVHQTYFLDGTITLNKRVGDTEHARVFWPFGTHWVDAIPHPATADEVHTAVKYSLGYWF
jgi:hypothetical protein